MAAMVGVGELSIIPVESRRQRKLFLEFPRQLYRDDPNWVPAIRKSEQELLNFRPHPFYERNEIQHFLALRGTEVCGRIAAIHNRAHVEHFHEPRGFFGFFECKNDPQAARALLSAACDWLAARGLPLVRGPASPSINYMCGVLVEGFDSPPTFLLPYNPPYYGALIEACGFHKTQDLYAYHGDAGMQGRVEAKLWPVAQQIAKRFNVSIRTLGRRNFRKDLEEFLAIFNKSLVGQHWGFVPFTSREITHFAKDLRWLLVRELAIGVEIEGRLAGVALVLPDYNPCIKRIDGRLFPFGWLRLLAARRTIKKYRVVAANVLPEYQLMGLGMVLMGELALIGIKRRGQEIEFSWVAESNKLSRGALEKGGAPRIKTYRMYDGHADGVGSLLRP